MIWYDYNIQTMDMPNFIIRDDPEAGAGRDPTYVLGCCWHCVASYYVTFQILDSNLRKLVCSISMQKRNSIYLICSISSYILCAVKLNIVLLLEFSSRWLFFFALKTLWSKIFKGSIPALQYSLAFNFWNQLKNNHPSWNNKCR